MKIIAPFLAAAFCLNPLKSYAETVYYDIRGHFSRIEPKVGTLALNGDDVEIKREWWAGGLISPRDEQTVTEIFKESSYILDYVKQIKSDDLEGFIEEIGKLDIFRCGRYMCIGGVDNLIMASTSKYHLKIDGKFEKVAKVEFSGFSNRPGSDVKINVYFFNNELVRMEREKNGSVDCSLVRSGKSSDD